MPNPTSLRALTPSQLLFITQSADPNAKLAWAALLETYGGVLAKLVAKVCQRYYLQDQDREEVLAETYLQLVNPDITRFQPSRGTPGMYLKGRVQNAARKVLTQRGARRRKSDEGNREADELAASRPATHPVALGPAEEAEQHDTVMCVLDQAAPRVRRALELCYWEKWSMQSIAAHLGVSRFALGREIRAFFATMNERLGNS